jgi:hypothetical protein
MNFKKILIYILTSFTLFGIFFKVGPIQLFTQASGTDPYYLVGNFGGSDEWNINSTTYPLQRLGVTSKYQWVGVLEINREFKIRDSDGGWDWTKGWSAVSNAGSRSDGVISQSSANIKVNNTFRFLVEFDNSNDSIYVGLYFEQAPTTFVNQDRFRLWVDRGGYESANALVSIQYGNTVSDTTVIYSPSGFVERSLDYYYAYFDLPLFSEITQFRIVRLSEKRGTIWTRSPIVTWNTTNHANRVLFVNDNGNINDVGSHSLTFGAIQSTFNRESNFLAKVLEGYLTCSDDSILNGYGEFTQMRSTYFFDGSTLKTIIGQYVEDGSLTDYTDGASYTTNRGLRVVNAYDKYVALAKAANQAFNDITRKPNP